MLPVLTCRFCDHKLDKTVIDLGATPLSNSYLSKDDLDKKEIFYPLHVRICDQCFLVQLPQVETPKAIFEEYAYFSSCSDSWLAHCANYVDMMIKRFSLNSTHHVVEIASNDGYLLQYFLKKNISVLGVEPAKNVAKIAIEKGVPTTTAFFGEETATILKKQNKQADVIAANNVLAHVPDLNDFVSGFKVLLKPTGVITIEFPHLLKLMKENQFDTIYHEHFSYFSLFSASKIFEAHKMTIFDVEELTTHGGSLRIFVKHESDTTKEISNRVEKVLSDEKRFGLTELKTYKQFSETVVKIKHDLLQFLLDIKKSGKKVAGYGAPAKGNTLLNHFGISSDLLSFTVDKNEYKQGKYLPGTRIPIFHPEHILKEKPDYLLLLPWNLKNEIMSQMTCIKEWGGKFVVTIPEVQIF